MTRAECEQRLCELTRQAAEIYRQYNPDATGLWLSWYHNDVHVLDEQTNGKFMVNASQYSDGHIASWDW